MFRLLPRRRPAARPAHRTLLECPRCDADALCPMEWDTFGETHWVMWLRCGECGDWLETVADNRTAAALDVLLDRQQSEIARAARAMEAERMSSEAETFIAALRSDLIDAGDFAR